MRIADEMRIPNVTSLLVLYELFTASSLSKQDITEVLETYALSAGLLTREDVQSSIIQLACTDTQWWYECGTVAIKKLYASRKNNTALKVATGLASLAERAVADAYEALINGDEATGAIGLHIGQASAPPDSNPILWLRLLHGLSTSIAEHIFRPLNMKDRTIHLLLLRNWAQIEQRIDDRLILPWLQVPWSEIGSLLAQRLPSRWYVLAIKELINHPSVAVPNAAVELATRYVNAFAGALAQLMDKPQTQPTALDFFTKLINYGYSAKLRMLSLLIDADLQVDNVDSLLAVARLSKQEKLDVFEKHAQRLLAVDKLSPQIIDLITTYVSNFNVGNLSKAEERHLLEQLALRASELAPACVQSINDLRLAAEGIEWEEVPRRLKIDPQYLQTVGQAISRLQAGNNIQYVSGALLFANKSVQNKEELDCVVVYLASAFNSLQHNVLFHLAKAQGDRLVSDTSYRAYLPYITLALEYARSLDLSTKEKERFLKHLFPALLRGASKHTYDEIDRVAKRWIAVDRDEWTARSAHIKPTTLKERLGGIFTRNRPK
jgi:hypothetical protein